MFVKISFQSNCGYRVVFGFDTRVWWANSFHRFKNRKNSKNQAIWDTLYNNRNHIPQVHVSGSKTVNFKFKNN